MGLASAARPQSTRGERMATSSTPERLRVLVASDHALVGDSVRAALATRGHEVVGIRWPKGAGRLSRRRRPPPVEALPEVGLLLSDLDSWSRIEAATLIVEWIHVPWVALTTSPRGPAWGGLLAVGVEVVLPVGAGLEDVSNALLAVAGGGVGTPAGERAELEDSWRETCARHVEVTERISLLTPREREVLSLMYGGTSVAEIADAFEVTPATVRTQVKAVLRKLDVKTQLAAVAAFDDALDAWDQRVPHRLADPRPSEPRTTV